MRTPSRLHRKPQQGAIAATTDETGTRASSSGSSWPIIHTTLARSLLKEQHHQPHNPGTVVVRETVPSSTQPGTVVVSGTASSSTQPRHGCRWRNSITIHTTPTRLSLVEQHHYPHNSGTVVVGGTVSSPTQPGTVVVSGIASSTTQPRHGHRWRNSIIIHTAPARLSLAEQHHHPHNSGMVIVGGWNSIITHTNPLPR